MVEEPGEGDPLAGVSRKTDASVRTASPEGDPLDARVAEVEATAPERIARVPPVGRVFPALLAILTGLLLVFVFGAAAVVLTAGPELFPDADGGVLYVKAGSQCGAALFDFLERECLSNATVAVQYGADPWIPARWGASSFGHYEARIQLEQARATVRVDAHEGTWVREVWVPEGTARDVRVGPGHAPLGTYVEGRETGYAVLLAIPAFTAGWLAFGGAVWLFTGRGTPARVTRAAAICWTILCGIIALFLLFSSALGIGLVLVTGWFALIWGLTGKWIKESDARLAAQTRPVQGSPQV